MISITFDYQDTFNETKKITISDDSFNAETIEPLAVVQLQWAFDRLLEQVTPRYE